MRSTSHHWVPPKMGPGPGPCTRDLPNPPHSPTTVGTSCSLREGNGRLLPRGPTTHTVCFRVSPALSSCSTFPHTNSHCVGIGWSCLPMPSPRVGTEIKWRRCAGCLDAFTTAHHPQLVCVFGQRDFPLGDTSRWALPCGTLYHALCFLCGGPHFCHASKTTKACGILKGLTLPSSQTLYAKHAKPGPPFSGNSASREMMSTSSVSNGCAFSTP